MSRSHMPTGRNMVLTIVVMVFMLSGFAAAQEADQPVDTALTEAQELLVIADSLFNLRQYEKSRPVFEQALTAAQESGSASDQTEALAMIARTYLVVDDLETGRIWLDKAKRTADFDEPRGWSRYVGVLGRLLWKENDIERATMMFENMYDYCSKKGLHERAIDAAHMVAITGDIETQIIWARKAIHEAEAAEMNQWLGPLWNNLGATYEDLDRHYEALEAYQKARMYHLKHGAEVNKAIADWTVGHAFINLKDYETADTFIRPLLARFEEQGNDEFIGLTCRSLGEIELSRGNHTVAHDYFVRAEGLLKDAGMPNWDAEGYQQLLDRITETAEKESGTE